MGNRAMSLSIRSCGHWTRHHASVVLLSSAGLAGIAGCAFNVSPGERLAATAHEEADSKSQVKTSALSRLLKRQPKESTVPETETATSSTTVRGRLFSAIVDRFPSNKRDDVDPLLEAEIEAERERAEAGTESRIADAEEDKSAADSVVLAPKTERTDAELWKIFSEDSAAGVKTAAVDPTLDPSEPAASVLDRKSLQKRDRGNRYADGGVQQAARTRTASTSVANAPIVEIEHEDEANPFARFVPEAGDSATVPGPESDANVVDHARDELQSLMTQARQQEQRGALHKAHESALEAAVIADREQMDFVANEERPHDLARRLERRLQAATHDPFSDASPADLMQSPSRETSPFSTGGVSGGSLSSTAPVKPGKSLVESEPRLAKAAASLPGTVFPKAPEWRGVRANSPVSLAVVEQPDSTVAPDRPQAVRHADVDDAATAIRSTGRLLPKSLMSREPVVKHSEQPLAFANEIAAEGPLLAPPREVAPLALVPAPPAAAQATVAALTAPAIADEELKSSRGYGGWIVGGILLVAGLWLLGVRGGNPFSRRTTAARR
jgi:hypothetical protein